MIFESWKNIPDMSCPVGWHSGTKTAINVKKYMKQNLQESFDETICRQYLIYYVVAAKSGKDKNFQGQDDRMLRLELSIEWYCL